MRKLIILSHKHLALGMKDTLDFFTHQGEQIIAIAAYEQGQNEFPEQQLANIIKKRQINEQLVILTDMLGGSVNQHAMKYLSDDVIVITGFNLSLALALLLNPHNRLSLNECEQIVLEAQKGIILMNTYQKINSNDDE